MNSKENDDNFLARAWLELQKFESRSIFENIYSKIVYI